jgi:RNA polymerase sigma factor for flagellar operon FliA
VSVDVGPPAEGQGPESANAGEPTAQVLEPPFTARQHALIRDALPQVERAAKHVARKSKGLVKIEDLIGVGKIELMRSAREYREDHAHTFAVYAYNRICGKMMREVEATAYQERIKRAMRTRHAYDRAFLRTDFDPRKHDEHEARRKYRTIANGLLAATFAAGLEEAQKIASEQEVADREEYETAIKALRQAMSKLSSEQLDLLLLIFRDLKTLNETGAALQLTFPQVRYQLGKALERLREELVALGVRRAPRPIVAPDLGPGFGEDGPANDGDPSPPGAPPGSKRPKS